MRVFCDFYDPYRFYGRTSNALSYFICIFQAETLWCYDGNIIFIVPLSGE